MQRHRCFWVALAVMAALVGAEATAQALSPEVFQIQRRAGEPGVASQAGYPNDLVCGRIPCKANSDCYNASQPPAPGMGVPQCLPPAGLCGYPPANGYALAYQCGAQGYQKCLADTDCIVPVDGPSVMQGRLYGCLEDLRLCGWKNSKK